MKKTFKYTAAALMLAGAFGIASQAQAAAIGIDNFSEGTVNLTDTGPAGNGTATNAPAGEVLTATSSIAGTNRQVTAEAGGPNAASEEKARINFVGNEYLDISNAGSSDGQVNILYQLAAPVDFVAAGATAIILDVLTIDTGVSVQILVNGDAYTPFQSFSGTGQFYALFTDFGNGTFTGLQNFANVTSLELIFQGVANWDGTFDNLRADVPPVVTPEPAGLALMGLGLAGFAAARKKKQA